MSNGIQHGDLCLFDCPRIRKSEFWQFIKLVAPHGSPPEGRTHWLSQDATDAYCLRCSKMFRFTKGSSNSVRRHMERFHRKELLKRQADNNKKGASPGISRKPANTIGAGSGSLQLAARKSKRGANDAVDAGVEDPSPISQTSANASKRPRDGVAVYDLRFGVEALVRWLVLAKRPFSIAEDPGFESFVRAISGEQVFVAPSREALLHRLEMMSENARFEVRQIVKRDVPHLALSVETWRALMSGQDSMNLNTHVAITCSYLGDDFRAFSYVLEAFAFDHLNPDKVVQLLHDIGLAKSSLSMFLVPNADVSMTSYTNVGVRVFPDITTSFNALVHTILAGSHDLDSGNIGMIEVTRSRAIQAIQAAILEVRNMVEWVRSDESAYAQLKQICPIAAGDIFRLPAFEVDRWTLATAHDVVSRLITMRSSLDGLLVRLDVSSCSLPKPVTKITPQSWMLLEGLVVLWRPLHEVVQVTVNEKVPSLPFVLPLLGMAIQLYSRANLFDEVKQRFAPSCCDDDSLSVQALDTLRCWIGEFLKVRYEDVCSSLAWISSLDPRYARLRHFSDQEREVCREKLLEGTVEVYSRQLPPTHQSTEALSTFAPPDFDNDVIYSDPRNPNQHIPGLMHRLLYDDDEDVPDATDGTLSRETDIAQARLYAANEISVYLNEHQVRKTRISCPLEWWRINRERFPFLAPLARIWLSTRACDLPSRPMERSLPAEFCESLGALELRSKLIVDTIVLRAHLCTNSSGGVSL